MKRTTQKPDDQHDDQFDMWGAKTGATTGATRDKNVSVLKINASPFALAYVVALVCFGNDQIRVVVFCTQVFKSLCIYCNIFENAGPVYRRKVYNGEENLIRWLGAQSVGSAWWLQTGRGA